MTSRRRFLQHTASVAAVGVASRIPARRLWEITAAEVMPKPDEAALRTLALAAVEAARAGGASFADVRIGVTQSISVSSRSGNPFWPLKTPAMPPFTKSASARYNVRALVDGSWGFVVDDELDVDAVTAAARRATVLARANRPAHRTSLELAPTPVVQNGTWRTPIGRDPFTVPLREQHELQLAALAHADGREGVQYIVIGFSWTRRLEVFASTEGALIVQEPTIASISASLAVKIDGGFASDFVGDIVPNTMGVLAGGYGYEVVQDATALGQKIVETADRALVNAKISRTMVTPDPGRYDVVLGHRAMASTIAATIFPALNAERVLGYHANEAGTSFASPPAEVLGKFHLGSPWLTIRGDRSTPHGYHTVGWDAEGVKPEDHVVVRDGIIQDYHTGRQTAAELADIYAKRGQALRSNGCAQPTEIGPAVDMPNLRMDPGTGNTTVHDLIADVKRGFYLDAAGGMSDQQVLNTQLNSSRWTLRKITNGKLGPCVRNFAMQFITPSFWKSLDDLAGAASVRRVISQMPEADIQVVPGRFRQVNVFNTGRKV